MKKNKLGKVLAIGAAAYAIKALADKNKEETALNNIFAGFTPLQGTPESSEIPFSPEEFKKWLDANPALKAALKGAAGEAGADGTDGVDGDAIHNFGGSLLQNGALETQTINGFAGTVIDGYYQGLPIMKANASFICSNKIRFRKDRVLRFTANMKVDSGNYQIYLFRKDKDGNNISVSGDSLITSISPLKNNTTFQKVEFLFFSTLANNYSFGDCDHVVIYADCTQPIYLNSLIVDSISLGEPLPSNLPYLPTGQEVYDTTTGDRGRFNGTAVDWYTMV